MHFRMRVHALPYAPASRPAPRPTLPHAPAPRSCTLPNPCPTLLPHALHAAPRPLHCPTPLAPRPSPLAPVPVAELIFDDLSFRGQGRRASACTAEQQLSQLRASTWLDAAGATPSRFQEVSVRGKGGAGVGASGASGCRRVACSGCRHVSYSRPETSATRA